MLNQPHKNSKDYGQEKDGFPKKVSGKSARFDYAPESSHKASYNKGNGKLGRKENRNHSKYRTSIYQEQDNLLPPPRRPPLPQRVLPLQRGPFQDAHFIEQAVFQRNPSLRLNRYVREDCVLFEPLSPSATERHLMLRKHFPAPAPAVPSHDVAAPNRTINTTLAGNQKKTIKLKESSFEPRINHNRPPLEPKLKQKTSTDRAGTTTRKRRLNKGAHTSHNDHKLSNGHKGAVSGGHKKDDYFDLHGGSHYRDREQVFGRQR